MESNPYRALRTLLTILAAMLFVGGLVIEFWTTGILSFVPGQPQFALSTLCILLLKVIGVVVLAFGFLLYAASRDPVR